MGFPRQEYWSELSFLNPGDFPHPGMEHTSLESPALTGRFFTTLPPGKPSLSYTLRIVTAKEYEHFTAYILLYNDKLCYRVTTLIYTHTMNDWEDPLPPVSDLLNNLFHLHSLNNPPQEGFYSHFIYGNPENQKVKAKATCSRSHR